MSKILTICSSPIQDFLESTSEPLILFLLRAISDSETLKVGNPGEDNGDDGGDGGDGDGGDEGG